LNGGIPTRLTAADGSGVHLSSGPGSAGAFREGGWLLWVRAGTNTLAAQRLDSAKAALIGEPVTPADGWAWQSRARLLTAPSRRRRTALWPIGRERAANVN